MTRREKSKMTFFCLSLLLYTLKNYAYIYITLFSVEFSNIARIFQTRD